MSRLRPGDEGHGGKGLRSQDFAGGTAAEAFALASAWLARNDGAIEVLDVSLHYLQIGDIPDPWDLTIYFSPA